MYVLQVCVYAVCTAKNKDMSLQKGMYLRVCTCHISVYIYVYGQGYTRV